MPSLLDALASLSAQCELISELSDANTSPTGPFTVAQLRGHLNVMSILRDAEDHEKRLFSNVSDAPTGSGKVAEKRAKGMVTPLRNGLGAHLRARDNVGTAKGKGRADAKDDGSGWNDPEKLLGAALTLVDEYRPMPRAREHIVALQNQHADLQSAIAVLEENINESGLPTKRSALISDSLFDEEMPELPDDEDEDHNESMNMSPEDWLKKEEEALKAMEAEVAELRKQKAQQAAGSRTPISPRVNKASPSPRSALPPASNGSRLAASPASPKFALRPAPASSSKQPSPSPSPLAATFGRSADLARSPNGSKNPSSTTKEEAFVKRGLARSVVGKPRMRQPSASPRPEVTSPAGSGPSHLTVPHTPATPTSPLGASPRRAASTTPTGSTPSVSPRYASLGRANGKSPARSPLPVPSPHTPSTPARDESAVDAGMTPTPKAMNAPLSAPPSAHKRKVVEGVEIRSDVRAAVTKIWSTLSEVLRQGEGSPTPEQTPGTAETIKHIAHLAQAPLPTPLSPSTTSTISSLPVPGAPPAPYRAPPLTSSSILTCTLLLAMLRAPGLVAEMTDLKEIVGAAAAERGWEGDIATKIIYGLVAKRTAKIDRRGGGKGRLLFAI